MASDAKVASGSERSTTKRVIVNVNGQKFRVPCKDETIVWLQEDVSRRYERHNKLQPNSVSLAEIRGCDGSLLDANDSVMDSVDDMEELVGVLDRLGASSQGQGLSSVHVHSLPAITGAHARNKSEESAHVSSDVEQTGPPAGAGGASWGDDGAGGHAQGGEAGGEEELDAWAKETLRTATVKGHKDGITCVHYDGDMVVTGGRDRIVRVWNSEAQSVVRTCEGHTTNVRCVQAEAGLVVSGGEAAVRVWSMETGAQTATLEGHAHYVSCLHMDSERRLVTGSWDRTLRIWALPPDGSATRSTATLEGHTASVLCLKANGDRMASGSLTGEVFVWSLLTGATSWNRFADKGTAVQAIDWDRNLIYCAADLNIKVLDIISGRCEHTLSGHTDAITCLVLHMPYVITGSRDATVKVWSTRTWRCVRTISCPGVRCMAVAQRTLIVGLDTGELQWWRLT